MLSKRGEREGGGRERGERRGERGVRDRSREVREEESFHVRV